jgi:serine/threonine protein kinase
VRLVRDDCADDGDIQYAVKLLCKGISINDDNTVFHAPKPGILETEVEILRRLQGKEHNLSLVGVYEGRRYLYLITELCLGGDLHDFRSACLQHFDKGVLLPSDIVREVTIKILRAVEHCHKHGVIHRDLKPANVMFVRRFDPTEKVGPIDFVDGLRIIDYGSGCSDDPPQAHDSDEPKQHNTMAGSAFYNSPEMFARKYTNKTDVWSAGAVVYVFAVGFPDGVRLQSVFDTMHKAPSKGERDLKKGMMPPGASDSLPDSFWQMLDKSLLVYRHRVRPSAGEVNKSSEFLKS